MSTRLFDEGAQAAAVHIGEQEEPVYICPLCFCRSTDPAAFTRDHVPAKSLPGPRFVVLTCRACNSAAGVDTQVHALRREQVVDFLQGTMDAPIPARLVMGDATVRVDIQALGSSVLVTSGPDRNSPELEAAGLRELTRRDELGGTFRVMLPVLPYHRTRARVGLLRDAYLAAFALYGYSYVGRADLLPVRDQLSRPAEDAIRCFSVIHPESSIRDRRAIGIATAPAYLAGSLAVCMGRHTVFLPVPGNCSPYDALGLVEGKAEFRVRSLAHWPERPIYAWDLALRQHQRAAAPCGGGPADRLGPGT